MTVNQGIAIESILNGFHFLNPNLRQEMLANAQLAKFDAGTVLVKEAQYVSLIPLVVSGILKVFISSDDKELLLYYIQKEESCIMTFAAGLKNEPSKIFAVTEDECEVLLFPIQKVLEWVKQYPEFNALFYAQYYLRYSDLLQTIQQVVFEKLDTRLFSYLKERARLLGSNRLKISHKQIAMELGTAREVITRVLRKLEEEGKLVQIGYQIELL